MKVLLTGATGFLGKVLMEMLVNHPQISSIHAVSRYACAHPSLKVRIIQMDLSKGYLVKPQTNYDAIIHLAGRYDFNDNWQANYLGNVVTTVNLIEWIKTYFPACPVFYASTYAIAQGSDLAYLEEKRIASPPRNQSYALSKHMAEEALFTSNLNVVSYRLGVVVGDAQTGKIEKIDGPYYLMQLLKNFRLGAWDQVLGSKWGRNLQPQIPLPISQNGLLPMVPVDMVAKVFTRGLFKVHKQKVSIYNVCNPESIPWEGFCRQVVEEMQLNIRVRYVPFLPRKIIGPLSTVLAIPRPAFDFAVSPPNIATERFSRVFSDIRIPHFDLYKKAFVEGFFAYLGQSLSA